MAVQHDRRLSSGVGSVLQPALKESYVSPRPASRVGVSSDAAKYLRRNRGSSSLWLVKRCASIDLDDDDDGSLTVRSCQTARAPRLNGNEASEIFRRNQGSVGVVLDENNQIGYSSPRPQSRLPSSEAEANARRKAGLFEQPAQSARHLSSQTRPRLVSTEAKANATKNAGMVNELLKSVDRPKTSETNASRSKSDLSLCLEGLSARGGADAMPCPRQRVKPEAEDIARKSAGKTCADVIAGRLPGDPVCDVRAKGIGRDNYEASRCGSVGTLFSTYGQQSAAAAGSRASENIQEGPRQEIAKHGKTGTLCFLMNNYGNLPRSPRPENRLRSEGKRYVCRNGGNNMAKCLNQAAKPARRSRSAAHRKKTA